MKTTIAQSKYPIILVHGLFGFESIAGYPYFYGIDTALQTTGANVFVPAVSAANTTEERGAQLYVELQKILEQTKTDKLNLIGHSHGALTARYIAALYPELVASVTSVNGVNHGSEVADMVLKALSNKLPAQMANKIVTGFASLMGLLSTKPHLPQDFIGALHSLSTEGVAQFNDQYPQGLPSTWGGEGNELEANNVYYYSWSGIIKQGATKRRNAMINPLHIAAKLSSQLFTKEAEQNDGLVGRFSSHLGKVIASDYSMNHFDAINQLAGLCSTPIDTVNLYVEHAARLKRQGL